ncbi:MAG: radical SAM protein, partial [Crenarchaeota archaeon]|nr:radical SAM protein [Thermoproteota archaeon]
MQKIIGKDKFKKNFYERISDFFYFRLIELSPLKMILSSSFFKIKGNKKKFPTVLQLPITYKCNSKCKMCDIWKMKSSDEYSIEDFELLLRDPIFKEITSVGINGGEPSLLKNLPEYAKVIVKLPKISSLNIISNGFNQKLLLFYVEKIYQMCKIKKIKFHISISLDGYGEIHNIVRGKENAFEKTIATIDEIILNQEKYCDSLDLGCTIIQ